MSSRRRTLTSALRTALSEEAGAETLFTSMATCVKDTQLKGTFRQFGSQQMGAVATIEGLLDSRGVNRPVLLAATRLRAAMQGRAARVRSWRDVVGDVLDRTERRVHLIAEAASDARNAGDVDAARSLTALRDSATAQATWLRDYLR